MEQEKFGLTILSGKNGNPQPYRDRRKPVLSFCVHNPYKSAHFPLNIPNVQVEVNILPMIQFIQGYFALK